MNVPRSSETAPRPNAKSGRAHASGRVQRSKTSERFEDDWDLASAIHQSDALTAVDDGDSLVPPASDSFERGRGSSWHFDALASLPPAPGERATSPSLLPDALLDALASLPPPALDGERTSLWPELLEGDGRPSLLPGAYDGDLMASMPPGPPPLLPSLPPPSNDAHGDASEVDAALPPLGPEDVGRLFAEYQRYVARIGGRILDNGSEVDDLVQDVFLATLRDVHKLRDRSRLKGWLATVASRLAKRRRSRRSFLRQHLCELEPSLDVPSEAPSPERSAEATVSMQRLLALPSELRQPWWLRHVEGATLDVVAESCGCSLSTAQRRIKQASERILGAEG